MLQEQNPERKRQLQSSLWDDGIIAEFMSREDTCGVFLEDGVYNMIVYGLKDTSFIKEAIWAFRILRFLGASPGFCVHWWAIDKPRILEPGAFPTRAEVNGGWAYRGRDSVWIFRSEEWDRVLIHECVHALNWDVFPSTAVKACLEKSLNGTLMDALGESVTELLAEWFWCIIHSPESDFNGTTWAKQKDWQLKQAYQILARRPVSWSEDTSVFAYYVLKAAIGQEDNEFFISWYAGIYNPDSWCRLWAVYEPIFMHKSLLVKDTVNKRISLMMTNPALKSLP